MKSYTNYLAEDLNHEDYSFFRDRSGSFVSKHFEYDEFYTTVGPDTHNREIDLTEW